MSNPKAVIQARIKNLTTVSFNIISSLHNEDLHLIELDDGQRLIADLTEGQFYSTRTLDSGISFEGTGYQKLDVVEPKVKIHLDGPALTNKIMKILKLDTSEGWSVVDSVGHLHLVHYREEADMNLVGHLKGILVDVEHELILTSSYGDTPMVKLYQIKADNTITLYSDKKVHEFPLSETVIKPVYEGVIMRVIYYDGQIYRLIHKKIRPLKSRWVNTPYFTRMYKEAGGPEDQALFNLDKKYSPYCYVFLVVHPQLLLATRQNVKHPYVVLLNVSKMWDTCPFPEEDIDWELATLEMDSTLKSEVNHPHIHQPKEMTLAEANRFLLDGYGGTQGMDVRQGGGEAVILYRYKDGQVVDILKVNSLAYDFRLTMRGNDPNLYHRFFDFVADSYKLLDKVDLEKFNQKYILFYEPKTRMDLLDIIWRNYVFSLPLPLQNQALTFKDQFIKDREKVTRWLQNNNDEKIVSKRGATIIQNASNVARKGKTVKDQEVIKNNSIKIQLLNEYGTSLYTLIKCMKK